MKNEKDISRRKCPDEFYFPTIVGSEENVLVRAFLHAKRMYGGNLPKIVRTRIEWELDAICKHNFSVIYTVLEKIANTAKKRGYPVSSSGCSASSFVAYLLGITEINPLPPHYMCLNCRYSNFESGAHCDIGYDLSNKKCPICGQELDKDGFNLSVETLLGIDGDKLPDIRLRFPENYVSSAAEHLEKLFGEGTVYHLESEDDSKYRKSAFFIIPQCEDVKHLSFEELQDHFLKFDLSGDPLLSKLWSLEQTTGVKPDDAGVKQRISNRSENYIATRDDVFQFLVKKGVSRKDAYKYMRIMMLGGIKRKETFLENWRETALKFNVTIDYVEKMEEIDNLPSKAEKILCEIENYQLDWYKEYCPKEF